MRRTRLLKILVAILLVAGLLVPSTVIALTSPADGSNLLLGNPSKAVHNSSSSPNNYLMTTSNYTLSYNKSRGEPNWVSWYLGPSSLGSTDRLNDFRADGTLPTSWYEVQANGYSGSGFDRGHNCPSADRTSSVAANSSTFLMTNMIPQAPRNNEGTWANFENYLRNLVRSGDELYIVMGSYGSGGTGSKGTATTVDGGHVTVPAHIWKVAVVLSNGTKDLSRITTKTRVIAINTPNINTISSKWQTYVTSVDKIEAATGDDLLSNVPAAIQKVIEAKVDSNPVASPVPVVVAPPVSGTTTFQPATKDYTVYVTATGKTYHRLGCQYLSKSCIPILRSKAIAEGYRPCKVCNP